MEFTVTATTPKGTTKKLKIISPAKSGIHEKLTKMGYSDIRIHDADETQTAKAGQTRQPIAMQWALACCTIVAVIGIMYFWFVRPSDGNEQHDLATQNMAHDSVEWISDWDPVFTDISTKQITLSNIAAGVEKNHFFHMAKLGSISRRFLHAAQEHMSESQQNAAGWNKVLDEYNKNRMTGLMGLRYDEEPNDGNVLKTVQELDEYSEKKYCQSVYISKLHRAAVAYLSRNAKANPDGPLGKFKWLCWLPGTNIRPGVYKVSAVLTDPPMTESNYLPILVIDNGESISVELCQ